MSDPLTSIPDDTFEGLSQVVPAWVPDEVDDYDEDYDYTLPPAKLPPHPPSSTTSDSSRTLVLSSNKLSLPSGLPKDTIARLTHDELRLNPEFVTYVGLVKSLQDLIESREKTAVLPTSHRKFHSISLHRLAHSFSTATKPLSTSSSLCPNQSASQVSSSPLFIPFPRPDKRPSNLPPEILWTWDDCKKDPYVDVSPSNVSRPPMRRAIRHEDGTILTDGQWKAIQRTAMLVARTRLQPLILTAQPGATQLRKKMYFKRYFSTEWAAALRELESLAPLLSLCAEEYKADHTLGAVLHDEAS